jgi:NAD+ synthase (glutamine-hydrolysing)
LNPIVGDIAGNTARLAETVAGSMAERPDLVVFPELYLVGYPPRDLLERGWFIERTLAAVEQVRQLSTQYPEAGILFGAPLPTGETSGKGLYNAAILTYRGEIIARRPKTLLPTYDVFDEERHFDPARQNGVVPFKGERLGLSICEDAWNDPGLWPSGRMYTRDPIAELAAGGATLLLNISASPFTMGKEELRYRLISRHARKHGLPFLYVNQVGANDELIFDGGSLAVDRQGECIYAGPAFVEAVQTIDTEAAGAPGRYAPQSDIASVYDALVLGTRDYLRKCGFKQAVIGLSGGIDSALTCCIAVDALGRENVLGVSMPSPYSSAGSIEDSRQLARNLGVEFHIVPISDVYQAYLGTLSQPFAGRAPDTTEENIQARIRGNILMAYSNKFGHLVLTTGNKSEVSVGYCTLYGDMSGGLAVISDVPKTMVYALSAHVNRAGEIIPRAIFEKAPSAELRPNQTDQDTLPPYDILDQILSYYVEEGYSSEQIIAQGFEPATVRWVLKTVARNEYKRKQAAPGLKVTSKAFGVGRRFPIAARYES